MSRHPLVAPSILTADFARLGDAVRAVDAGAGADVIVAGSAIIRAGDYAAAIGAIRAAGQETMA